MANGSSLASVLKDVTLVIIHFIRAESAVALAFSQYQTVVWWWIFELEDNTNDITPP